MRAEINPVLVHAKDHGSVDVGESGGHGDGVLDHEGHDREGHERAHQEEGQGNEQDPAHEVAPGVLAHALGAHAEGEVALDVGEQVHHEGQDGRQDEGHANGHARVEVEATDDILVHEHREGGVLAANHDG